MMKLLRFAFPLLACAAPYLASAEGGNDSKQATIRVLSYNIHHGAGMDGKIDLERIVGIIKAAAPDIVSLQEVDDKAARSKGVDQAKELARLTGMEFVFGASMDLQGGKYANALLTKLTVKDSRVIPLPGEPRSALCATMVLPGKSSASSEFLFIATHFDTTPAPRLASVPLIEKEIREFPKMPAILAGDLNASPGSPTMKELGKTWENATSREGLLTCPADDPTIQIDYILHRPQGVWKVLGTRVLEEAVASDHRPILAVLQLLPEDEETAVPH